MIKRFLPTRFTANSASLDGNKLRQRTRQQQRGEYAEQLARDFLLQQGLTLITQNYQCRFGEIDLILKDTEVTADRRTIVLVFVEVRHRRSSAYGTGEDSVHFHKQSRLRKTAEFYLAQSRDGSDQVCRFDVISIDGELDPRHIRWLKNAF